MLFNISKRVTKMTAPSLNGRVGVAPLLLLLFFCFFTSCQSDTEAYDPYHDWQGRNEAWFAQIADSARTAIRRAQQTYGDDWQDHCDWRMYKTLSKAQGYNSGSLSDSICCHIVARGSGAVSPLYTDSVRCNYRGWLMPTTDANGLTEELVFDQTYYGAYDVATAAPSKKGVASVVPGFATALQHMAVGDDWQVYIPAALGYGQQASGVIPAYSVLHFRLQLMGIYPKGTEVPAWK